MTPRAIQQLPVLVGALAKKEGSCGARNKPQIMMKNHDQVIIQGLLTCFQVRRKVNGVMGLPGNATLNPLNEATPPQVFLDHKNEACVASSERDNVAAE